METEENEAPNDIKDLVPDSPHAYIQREEHSNLDHTPILVDPVEPVGPSKRSIGAPPTKRRPSWLRETLQEAKKHSAPPCTFRESKRP